VALHEKEKTPQVFLKFPPCLPMRWRNREVSQRRPKELEGYPFIIRAKGSTLRKIVLQVFKNLRIRPALLIEAGGSEFIKLWVSEGRGVSVIVRRIGEDEERRGMIKTVPLAEDLHLEVAILYLREERSNPEVRAVVRYMENKGKSLIRN
jgi:DNA-binding transcriptional LysR family regulator